MSRVIVFLDHNFIVANGIRELYPLGDWANRWKEILVLPDMLPRDSGEWITMPDTEKAIKKIIFALNQTQISLYFFDDFITKILKKRNKNVGVVTIKKDNLLYCYCLFLGKDEEILLRRFFKVNNKEELDEEIILCSNVLKIVPVNKTDILIDEVLKEKPKGIKKRFIHYITQRQREIKKQIYKKFFNYAGILALTGTIIYLFTNVVYKKILTKKVNNVEIEIASVKKQIEKEFSKRVLSIVPPQNEFLKSSFSESCKLCAGGRNVIQQIILDHRKTIVDFKLIITTNNPLIMGDKRVKNYKVEKGENIAKVKFKDSLQPFEQILKKGAKEWQ